MLCLPLPNFRNCNYVKSILHSIYEKLIRYQVIIGQLEEERSVKDSPTQRHKENPRSLTPCDVFFSRCHYVEVLKVDCFDERWGNAEDDMFFLIFILN